MGYSEQQMYVGRPNRLSTNKDENYHTQFGRYILTKANLWQQTYFIKKYLTNMMFYKGNQWIFEEDMDSFLMDESGDVRNRIQFVHNIIKPYVEYFRGSMVKMDLNFTVNSISRESINKREKALDFLLLMRQAAVDMKGPAAQALYNKYPINPDKGKTIESFNNMFVDEDAKVIKHLVQYIAQRNDIEDIKTNTAEDMAFGGISIIKEYDSNGHQYFKAVYPPNFFFDITARKKDLSDAEWMGDFSLKSAVEILERYQGLSMDDKEAIENMKCTTVPGVHNLTNFMYGYTGDKVPVYDVYWRDIENDTHGLVFDPFGYVCIVDMEKDGYTDKDLIPVEQLAGLTDRYDFINTLFNDGTKTRPKYRNTKKVTVEYIRYCTFIPQIYSNATKDIVLEFGVRPYTHLYHFENPKVDWPYMIGTYAYMDGELMSPLDNLISPQRYINRIMSMAESNINNSGGSGTIYDTTAMLDSDIDESEVQSKMNRSKPIALNGNGNIQNAVVHYDNTIKPGAISLFGIAKEIKSISDEIVGGGDALRGAGGGYRVSVGAIDQNLNQAITLQEPFFYAVYRAIFACYEAMASRGRRIYARNEREISIMVGDEGYKLIKITKNFELLDFRLMLDRAPSKQEQQQAANQSLLQMLQMQMIDDKTFAKYLNSCDISDIPYIVRESLTIKYEALARQKQLEARNSQLDGVIQSAALGEQNLEQQKNDELGVQLHNSDQRNQQAQAMVKQPAGQPRKQ